MTKEEFLSRQREAEDQISNKNHFIPWLSFMVTIAMFMAIPLLGGMLILTLFHHVIVYELVWEIAFCLLVLGLTHCERRYTRQTTVAILQGLGLRCACDRSPIFGMGKVTAETGKCWHCGERFFDTVP
jgi:hypothetical protein